MGLGDNVDRRKLIIFLIGVGLAIVGFVQFVHNFAMIHAYGSIAPLSGLTEEFNRVYEEEIMKAQLAMAVGLLGVFVVIFSCILVNARPKKEKVEPSAIEYERQGLTWERKNVQPPKQTEETVNQETKGSKYCPYCKEKLRPNALYCLKCFKKLD